MTKESNRETEGIREKETSFFDYVASGYYFRNNQSENPMEKYLPKE